MRFALTVGQKLRQLREQKGLGQKDISAATGLDQSYLSKVEKSKIANPSSKSLSKICSALDVSIDDLLQPATEHTYGNDVAATSIPRAGVAAGDDSQGKMVTFEHEGRPLRIPEGTTHVQIKGNSMSPVVLDGQFVFIDTGDRSARNGDLVVIVTKDGRSYFKRFYQSGTQVQLISINTTAHEGPVLLDEREIHRQHVVLGIWFEEHE